MSKMQNEVVVKDIEEKLKIDENNENKGEILTDYQGLTVDDLLNLRSKLKVCKCKFHIVKNTLLNIALSNIGITTLKKYLVGPTAIVYTEKDGDITKAAKILLDFSKTNDKIKIKAGVFANSVLSLEQVKGIANLPSKQVLISTMLMTMNMPLINFLNVLQAKQRNLLYVLNAIKNNK